MDELVVSDAIKNRFSCRGFKQKKIPEDQFLRILDAGRLAPSGSNAQPTSVIEIDNIELIKNIANKSGFLGVGKKRQKQSFLISADKVVAIVVEIKNKMRLDKWDESHPFAENSDQYFAAGIRDASIVASYMSLQATSLGISNCFVSWFDQKEVKELIDLPQEFYLLTFIAFGYSDLGIRPEKNRKSFDDFFRKII